MKLSTLVHLKNQLINSVQLDLEQAAKMHASPMCHLVQSHEIQFPDLTKQIHEDYQTVLASFARFSNTIDDVKHRVQDLIDSIENSYFVKSYDLFQEHISQDDNDYILDRKLDLPSDIVEYLHARMRRYGDWHHAGLIVRPGRWDWIEDLVSCDPLYLVDTNRDLLAPALDRFNPEYQRRLRLYLIGSSDANGLLDHVPDGQIGFCLAYYFFNFMPFELIRRYLEEIYRKLKPGGSVAFTFNNCDRAGGVELVERNYMCYTPGGLMMTMCESMGFEISHSYQLDSACTWIELRRPGELSSLRGGQSLARIVAKSK